MRSRSLAYEYNPNSARFDIPNPHDVENIFIGTCALGCFCVGIVLLFTARTIYFAHDPVRFGKSIVSAIGLLALGITYATMLLRQMRFFFGRGQPADLVPSLRTDEFGYRAADETERQIPDAIALRQTLQQNAITYRIPQGAIDNLLYKLVPDLVYSPRLTQVRVQLQARNLLAIAFVLVLFAVSLLGISNRAAIGWIGCFYFVLTNAVILRPLSVARIRQAKFSQRTAIAFIVLAIVAPVIFASLVPATGYALAGYIDIVPVTFAILASALIVTALVFRAGVANTVKPSQIGIAPHLETPSVNISPAQVYTELARELQRLWQEQVPNRNYLRVLPDVGARQGSFTADVIEETQPIPLDVEPMTFARAWSLPTTRPLVVVDALCTGLTIVGAGLLASGVAAHLAYNSVISGGALALVGSFGLRSANEFWRRFEFTSRIYWVDWNGTYARSSTKIGALLDDRVHTKREVISVESMTLRVWVAELDSVAFNTDRDRDIIAIRGLPDEATRVGRLLCEHIENAGSIMAPSAPIDGARMQVIDSLNAGAGGASSDQRRPKPNQQLPLVERPTAAMPVVDAGVTRAARFCTACGTGAAADAAFCSKCGTPLS